MGINDCVGDVIVKILRQCDVRPGDVLVCYSAQMRSEDPVEGSGYSHVAIALDAPELLESNSAGVAISTLTKLLESYDHVAVIRADLWDTDRIAALKEFASQSVGKPFDIVGKKQRPTLQEEATILAVDRAKAYFDGNAPPVPSNLEKYFCSQLVHAAFMQVGIVGSAAQIMRPESRSPMDLATDKVYGFFCGYLVPYPDYQVPADDRFLTNI